MLDFSRNHFELFRLPERFGLDASALDAAYRRLQSEVHPDRHASGSDADRRLALQASARVNEAYRALREPITRAEYLLSLHGIDARDETDTQLPLDFLERQLERREQASEAVEARDARTLAAVIDEVRGEASELEARVRVCLDERHAYDEARVPVRELRFLHKVGEDLSALDAALDEIA
ncbi:MAG TPA: Fe-S protein assembly co-chaperone HscB [Casimicrobiaceae bacterium]|jgi:molecular chaperone HscB